ncbi:unnamed protein product [Closterium sp. NIES-65]|nr:unnamed protein product [Closterium sp. NIES-65]
MLQYPTASLCHPQSTPSLLLVHSMPALHYEVLRGAVGTGAHVRDAAAYVFWASPTPSHRPSLLPPCNSFALPSLPLRGVTARWAAVTARWAAVTARWAAVTARGAAVTARWAAVTARGAAVTARWAAVTARWAAVTARWAAAAAFQEVVGRFGCISDAHHPRHTPCLHQRSWPRSPDPPFRHGALLATAALLPPLSASSPSCALTGTLSSLTSSLPSLLAPRSFRGRLAADLKVACCRLLSALAAALPRAHLPPLPVPALTAATACLHDMLAGDGGELQCARARFVSLVQEAAAAALWDLARSQLFPACTHLVHQIVTCHAATLESTSSAASVGGANTGQEDGERHGGTEGRGGEGGVDKGEMSRYELAERVVKALCAAATNNRGRRAVSDVAVRAAAVEALGNAASIIPLLQAGGAGARGHAGTGGGAGTQVGEGEKEEVELRRQRGLVGLGWWEEGGESVVGALLRAAQDYTEDQRGDVGRLVREASMKALVGWVGEMYRLREVGEGDVGDGGGAAEASLPHGVPSPALPTTHDASSQQQRYIGMRDWCRAVAGRVVGVLMKQAGEKIDGTREVAGQGLQRLLWGGKHGAVMVGMRETREEAWTGEAVETCGAGGSTLGTSGGGEEGRDGGGSVRQCVGGRAEGSGVCRDVDGWEQLRQHVPSDPHFAWKNPAAVFPRRLTAAAPRLPPASAIGAAALRGRSLSLPHRCLPARPALPQTSTGGTGGHEGGRRGGWGQAVGGGAGADSRGCGGAAEAAPQADPGHNSAIAALLQAEFFGSLSADSPASDEHCPALAAYSRHHPPGGSTRGAGGGIGGGAVPPTAHGIGAQDAGSRRPALPPRRPPLLRLPPRPLHAPLADRRALPHCEFTS